MYYALHVSHHDCIILCIILQYEQHYFKNYYMNVVLEYFQCMHFMFYYYDRIILYHEHSYKNLLYEYC